MECKEYYLGLDGGTDSVGYAVTDPDYNLIKFHGEPLWGTTVFESAKNCAERRGYRVARRATARRKQRISLVADIFAKEIAKVDPNFFIKIKESALWREDASCPYESFDLEYNKTYPTIHHLICDLMYNNAPHNVRLVYRACAWLVAHRGHFLSSVDTSNIKKLFDFNCIYQDFIDFFDELPWRCDADAFSEILHKKLKIKEKLTEFYNLLFDGKKTKNDDYPYSRAAMLNLLCGGKVSANDLFITDAYSEVKAFSLNMDEDAFVSEVLSLLGDDAKLIVRLKAMYDWSVLVDARRECATISEGKVAVYEQHKQDLVNLKYIINKYAPQSYSSVFRKYDPTTANYTAYVKNFKSINDRALNNAAKGGKISKASKYELSSYLIKILNGIEPDDADQALYNDIMMRLEQHTFLPKQVDPDNRVIPYQLYWYEMKRILANASEYLPFLKEADNEGLSPAEKLLSIMTFRVPYYVGPLCKYAEGGVNEHAWITRKAEGRIYPWNFESKVDLDACERDFINRMTNTCTYLPDEDVLSKHSLLYCKYMVLSEINKIRIDSSPITVECKQRLFNELFMMKRRVTRKQIDSWFIANGYMQKDGVLSGLDTSVKSSLASYHDFKQLLISGTLTEAEVERIIERRTYTEDDTRYKKWLAAEFPQLSKDDLYYVSRLKYSDFGNLSRELLDGIEGCNILNGSGECLTIMGWLWETNDNLMQLLLSDNYTFKDIIADRVKECYGANGKSVDDLLDDMRASAPVRRSIARMIEITREVTKLCKHPPKKIFIEMARGASEKQKNERNLSRYEQLKKLYANVQGDIAAVQRQLDELGAGKEKQLQQDSLYLYFLQLGKSMYTGKPIVKDGIYNKDHIYPQCLIKDDSVLNNMVLVESEVNGRKDDEYPLPESIRNNPDVRAHWEILRRAKLITAEKYYRLTRTTPFSDDEKRDFINRQLVETRQATKAAAAAFKLLYPQTKVVYVKAGLVSDFRNEFDMLKTRSVNDLHHAKDAYLNIVVGDVYHQRFTNRWFSIDSEYNVQVKKLFKRQVTVCDKRIWNGEDSIAAVKKVINKNNIHFTRYAFCRKGGLFDQMPLRASAGLVPRKKGLDSAKYGGYNKTTASFFILVGYVCRKKHDIMVMPVELMHSRRFLTDNVFAEEYAILTVESILGKPISNLEFPLGMRLLKINAVFELDGCRVCLSGKSSGGSKLLVSLMTPAVFDYKTERYVKRLDSFAAKLAKNPKLTIDAHFDGITPELNLALYKKYCDKIQGRPFNKILQSQIKVLQDGEERFSSLSTEEQVSMLLKIVSLIKTGRSGGCDLRLIGGVGQAGTLVLSSSISNWKKKYSAAYIIDASVTGAFEKRSPNILELL